MSVVRFGVLLCALILATVSVVVADCACDCSGCCCGISNKNCSDVAWNVCSDGAYCSSAPICGSITNIHITTNGGTSCGTGSCQSVSLYTTSTCNGVEYNGSVVSCCSAP